MATDERILQFGCGNFLRAFADLFIHEAREAGQDTGAVLATQSTPGPRAAQLNRQNGGYHVLVRGYRNGELIDTVQPVKSISRALVAADSWPSILAAVQTPNMRHIICNTTEAGYVLDEADASFEGTPQGFPARLTALLYARYNSCGEGISILPCELLENNGDLLHELVLEQAQRWNLPDRFLIWMDESCAFHNTLVDRIVSGMPDEHPLKEQDELLAVADPFALWVIETEPNMQPFIQHPCVRYVEDAAPFQLRKIRILNGAHTALVEKALPLGIETVREAAEDSAIGPWLKQLLFDEIVPALEGRVEEPETFARGVLERFANPFVRHRLCDIALYHEKKLRIRLFTTRDDYAARFGGPPPLLDELLKSRE